MVPIASVLGSDRIPAGLAMQMSKALDQLTARGAVDPAKKWQLLDVWSKQAEAK